MLRNTVLNKQVLYYALGNTPAVCLTQDLPPEQDADILLLGCGDARNVLFTCFADSARRIDVTCCDNEAGIHARNVLLYSLLIDDTENLNTEQIWNIYYDWKIDKSSLELLETQTKKLLTFSVSIDQWHSSVYGSSIRFCDAASLAYVRVYWVGFQLGDLSNSEKERRRVQLQAAINRAKAFRKDKGYVGDVLGLSAVSPVPLSAFTPLTNFTTRWWDSGTSSWGSSTPKPTELNPALLYSPNPLLSLHYASSPLHGYPLSTAYIPLVSGPASHLGGNAGPSTELLVECAKSHFQEWASAFRKSIEAKSVIRIFSGNALTFGLALGGSSNLFTDITSSYPLKLHSSDYGNSENSAPRNFDVIDTSNLTDHLGPLNLLAIGANLLKYHASSTLYLETYVKNTSSLFKQLSGFLGTDVPTLSMLLGLLPPDLFTNSTDRHEQDVMIGDASQAIGKTTQVNARLRWKRLRGYHKSSEFPRIHIEAGALAKLLVEVHESMFLHEDPSAIARLDLKDVEITRKLSWPCYNRSSFAFLLSSLRAHVVTDWDRCTKTIYENAFSANPFLSMRLNFAVDLLMNMHLFGVDNGRFPDLDPSELRNAILAPYLPKERELPEQLCVTLRVPREQLKSFTSNNHKGAQSITVACVFEGGDPGQLEWSNYFTAVQVAFGNWQKETTDNVPCIVEDGSQLMGTADMFVSAIVPTFMLLQARKNVPTVKCGIVPTIMTNQLLTQCYGTELGFGRKKLTHKDVFITRYMPGTSAHPTIPLPIPHRIESDSAPVTVRLSHNVLGESKIESVTRRLFVTCDEHKSALANKSSAVKINFISPLTVAVRIEDTPELKLEFPIPVSQSNYKAKVARKSAYIEIESPLFDPCQEDSATLFLPVIFTEGPSCTISPTPWISTHLNLDAMPIIDIKTTKSIDWLNTVTSQMFSTRERHLRSSESSDPRTNLKDGLFSLFMHFTGLQGIQADCFGLYKKDGSPSDGVQALIFPSCLRLDLINHSVVLDSAVIPLKFEMLFCDPKAAEFLRNLNQRLCLMNVSSAEHLLWKAILPALVERCRVTNSWKHKFDCEYKQKGEVPLRKGLKKDGEPLICSCGVGKFPSADYLKKQMKKFPDLSYMINKYATRIAISPIFPVPYVEDCFFKGLTKSDLMNGNAPGSSSLNQPKCENCGNSTRKNPEKGGGLLRCSRCKMVWYCSVKCQKEDRKEHKPICFEA